MSFLQVNYTDTLFVLAPSYNNRYLNPFQKMQMKDEMWTNTAAFAVAASAASFCRDYLYIPL